LAGKKTHSLKAVPPKVTDRFSEVAQSKKAAWGGRRADRNACATANDVAVVLVSTAFRLCSFRAGMKASRLMPAALELWETGKRAAKLQVRGIRALTVGHDAST
jgi:hypothetical protein